MGLDLDNCLNCNAATTYHDRDHCNVCGSSICDYCECDCADEYKVTMKKKLEKAEKEVENNDNEIEKIQKQIDEKYLEKRLEEAKLRKKTLLKKVDDIEDEIEEKG